MFGKRVSLNKRVIPTYFLNFVEWCEEWYLFGNQAPFNARNISLISKISILD